MSAVARERRRLRTRLGCHRGAPGHRLRVKPAAAFSTGVVTETQSSFRLSSEPLARVARRTVSIHGTHRQRLAKTTPYWWRRPTQKNGGPAAYSARGARAALETMRIHEWRRRLALVTNVFGGARQARSTTAPRQRPSCGCAQREKEHPSARQRCPDTRAAASGAACGSQKYFRLPNMQLKLSNRRYAGSELKLLHQRVRRRHVSCMHLCSMQWSARQLPRRVAFGK
ncbi:MAG: hypothetical protein JWO97_1461 [Acidobacteria bacterium]|nr:hypothetical protein [Acidobacteriota bacterium]